MKDNIKILLGKRIKDIRESKELSQRDLSKKMGTGNGTLSSIEKGSSNLTLETLEKLAEALEVDLIELLNFKSLENEMPNVLKEAQATYGEIPETYMRMFSYCFKQGLRFQNADDYYYLWIIMKAIETKK